MPGRAEMERLFPFRSLNLRRWLAGGLLLLLGGCDTLPDYRYKITIEVATPEGVRHFSSVRQVVMTNALMVQAPNAPAMSRKLHGEAVVMDLPGGATVFAILERGRQEVPEDHALPTDRSRHGVDRIVTRIAQRGAHDLPRRTEVRDGEFVPLWPTLVRFTRSGDPKSVVEVDPDVLPGGGRVSRITVEITDEEVTRRVQQILPWIADYKNMSFSGNRYTESNQLADRLRTGNFITDPAS